MPHYTKPIPLSLLDEVRYDESSPSCLCWRKMTSRRGDYPGILVRGYYLFSHLGKMYRVHRVVWAIHYGLDVPPILDHINQDKKDNRIINLRDGTEHNIANRPGWSTKRDRKYKGVYPCRNKYQMVCGAHLEEGVSKTYDTEIEAALAYNEAALRLYGEYAHLNIIN